MRFVRCLAGVLVAAAVLSGCVTASKEQGAGSQELPTSMTVLASNTFKAPMQKLVHRFESDNPGLKVTVTYGEAPTLLKQLRDGAPADVLMTDDEASMSQAVADRLVKGEPMGFATNTMTLAVASGNPSKIDATPASLARTKLVMCEPAVPCGRAAIELHKKLGSPWARSYQEANVDDVVAKIIKTPADVGAIYGSDIVASGGKLQAVPEAQSSAVTTRSMVAQTSRANEMGEFWLMLMQSNTAAEMLKESGFGPK